MHHDKTDVARGFYHKYDVSRVDGRDEPGQKHDGCEYFVLDLDCDPFAIPAIEAYVKACRSEYPALASDLERKLVRMKYEAPPGAERV